MKRILSIIITAAALCACNAQTSSTQTRAAKGLSVSDITTNTKIRDVKSDADFGNWGRLLFPVNEGYYSGDTLGNLSLTWYSHINADKTVEIVRYVKEHTLAGEQVFYDIYTEAEKRADPAKRDSRKLRLLPEFPLRVNSQGINRASLRSKLGKLA